jgi:flagellar biosynthetic protein FlhB
VSGEKTEKPTPQKLKEARKKGQIPRTPELGAWGSVLAATMVIPMSAEMTMERSQRLVAHIRTTILDPDPQKALELLGTGLTDAAVAAAPIVLTVIAVVLAGGAAQGGLKPVTHLLKPDPKRLNPFTGMKRLLGPQGWTEGLKALVKTSVIGVVMYLSLKNLTPALVTAGALPLAALIETMTGSILNVIRTAAAVGLVIALGDYALNRRRIMKQIRMSKQDIKDEHKKTEGDPHVKGQIRAKQMQMSGQRMMSDVPKADVVMVNPTHVAVALRYEPSKGAPRVIAKGAGAVATKIRTLATEHRIPMVEDVPLARALYANCDVGQEIPAEFFAAVARVLAFVMTLKARGSAAGLHRPPAALSP